jgi:hypothetical protein
MSYLALGKMTEEIKYGILWPLITALHENHKVEGFEYLSYIMA